MILSNLLFTPLYVSAASLVYKRPGVVPRHAAAHGGAAREASDDMTCVSWPSALRRRRRLGVPGAVLRERERRLPVADPEGGDGRVAGRGGGHRRRVPQPREHVQRDDAHTLSRIWPYRMPTLIWQMSSMPEVHDCEA